jgi:hypothetical protein
MKYGMITNYETALYRGMICDRAFAEKSVGAFRERWPGLEWEVEETTEQFAVPGLICIGEVKAARTLKAWQYAKASQFPETFTDE